MSIPCGFTLFGRRDACLRRMEKSATDTEQLKAAGCGWGRLRKGRNGMKKRIAALLTALLLLATAVNASAGTINLPKGLKVIEAEAFAGTASIDKVIAPEGLEEIHSRAFANSSVSRVVTPLSVEYIAEDAFAGSEAVVGPDTECTSLSEVLNYLKTCAQRQVTDITFSYTSNLDEMFSTPDALWDILKNCGLVDWTQRRYTSQRRVEIEDIEYRQGFKIARAYMTGSFSRLTSVEMETYRIALSISRQAMSNATSDLHLERLLHDAIISRTTYKYAPDDDDWHAEDTAVGALYYGGAECDGYADAFYLLCTLSGLNAAYLTGDAYSSSSGAYEPHMWNLIYLNGGWHHVDLTWDDVDYSAAPTMSRYRYFNAGGNMLGDHQWIAKYSPVQPRTYMDWNVFFYTCPQAGENHLGAYYSRDDWAVQYVLNQKNSGAKSAHVMVNGGNHANGSAFNQMLQSAGLRGRWTTWTKNMDQYTCFDVLFIE